MARELGKGKLKKICLDTVMHSYWDTVVRVALENGCLVSGLTWVGGYTGHWLDGGWGCYMYPLVTCELRNLDA